MTVLETITRNKLKRDSSHISILVLNADTCIWVSVPKLSEEIRHNQ